MDYKVTKTVNLVKGTRDDKREEILQYFRDTWEIDEQIFASLKPESFYMRADALRHPIIFYYGHTATFYINKLVISK
ncbi:MAG: hypothetical protein P9L91_09430, partial [Candidatus Zophobacter franzmannii]|nr:hypothetical protein [Candidatus Zophobacter franzmannii]